MRGGVAALGVLATVWAVVSGCQFNVGLGSKPIVAKDALQKDIVDRLTRAGERFDSVSCQGDLGRPGATVDCTLISGQATRAFVLRVTTIDGNKINYSYAPRP